MRATETKFLPFLQGIKQFIIPIYQRTYSWKISQCQQLWEDIKRAAVDEGLSGHFVGSIVYIERGLYQVTAVPQLLVIDGQQRITTLSILLVAFGKVIEERKVPRAYLRVRDWNQFSWVIDIYPENEDDAMAEAIGREFIRLVEKQSTYFMKTVKNIAKEARHKIVQNPFKIYLTSAEGLVSLAENTPNQIDKENLCRASFFLFLSSFEGLLNLVYDLYLKSFLDDERIKRDLNRANIDLKLRLAPIYCTCFSGDTIKYQSDELERYMAIVELRNDFIHANLSPTMKTAVIKEDGFTFPIESRDTNKFQVPTNLSHLDIEHLQFVSQTIKEMAEAIINSMNHRFKQDFRNAIKREQIIIEQVDGENLIRLSLGAT